MTTTKNTPSGATGTKLTDHLVDRDCAILDGSCKCVKPWNDCKYIKDLKNVDAPS